MPEAMSHRKRVLAAVAGTDVDRPPVSFWGHAYHRESSAEDLAAATLESWRRHEWDFVKLNPRASYHGEVWGLSYSYSGVPDRKPALVSFPVKDIADWDAVTPRGVESAPLSEQLEAIRLVRRGLPADVLLIETVFSPLSIAADLAGSPETVLAHLRADAARVRRALDAIRDTFRVFASEALRAGADGLFYATVDWATRDLVTPDEYSLYARSDDLAILCAVSGATFNVLHVCRKNNLLADLADYPAHAVSWAATDAGNPTLARGLEMIRGAAVGGIAQDGALQADGPEGVLAQVLEGWRQTGGRRWIVGPGCSIPPGTPDENLVAVREAVSALAEEE